MILRWVAKVKKIRPSIIEKDKNKEFVIFSYENFLKILI